MRKKIIICLTFICILLITCQGCAEESTGETSEENVNIGKIVSLENNVTVIKNENGDTETEIPGKAEMPLFAGDRILTGENSRVKFILNQGSQFTLGESAEVAIDELSDLEDDEGQNTVLQLITGFMHSVIKGMSGDVSKPVVHTPTAVAGVRGTEFETVVSIDGATAIVVDEGSVEVEWEKSKTIVQTGQMAHVEEEIEDLKPVPAIPKMQRDWKGWRGKRKKEMYKKLPQMLPRYRKRFEKWADSYAVYIEDVKKAEMQVAETMEKARKAEEAGDQAGFQKAMSELDEQNRVLKKAVKKSRKQYNRFKSMSKHMKKLKKHVKKHKGRFNEKDLNIINSNISFVVQKDKHLKKNSRKLLSDLKKTAKKSKKFRKKHKHKGKKDKHRKHKDKDEHKKERKEKHKEKKHDEDDDDRSEKHKKKKHHDDD